MRIWIAAAVAVGVAMLACSAPLAEDPAEPIPIPEAEPEPRSLLPERDVDPRWILVTELAYRQFAADSAGEVDIGEFSEVAPTKRMILTDQILAVNTLVDVALTVILVGDEDDQTLNQFLVRETSEEICASMDCLNADLLPNDMRLLVRASVATPR